MSNDFDGFRHYLRDFDFRGLFTQLLGWDHHKGTISLTIEGKPFTLTAVAEKRGMVAFNCAASDTDGIPPYALRRKIERQVSKSAHEHLVIFTDQPKTTQVWQWVKREVARPTACREHTYHRSQPGDGLIQKLQTLEFSLEEEENLTVVDVAGRARAAFDVDRITKRFYDRFKTEHTAFLKFIKGIPSEDDQAWYASLMLNRLMFVYFIQKKGFLDNDPEYLRHRLLAMQRQHGKDKFYSFYRQFLLRLFHEGLNQPLGNRAAGLDALIGTVPYLNGGLFDVHRLEERNPEIAIPDKAFERLFDFFDAYQWHLDERPLRADNEINPDVLGYIFEKYINQKQMGAYYTKEDITGYIAQNTVIPFLFDAAEKKCSAAFKPGSPLWQLLCDDPDRYIYSAVRHGVDLTLPKAIAAGLDNVSKREGWNQTAPGEFALPTETWREHVTRRNRCLELRRKLAAGEIHSINDLITFNLDVRQFAQDAIENCETPELLRAFYRAICSISVLDPTCGSGAFLFAALNVLEPLYEACLERMQAFLDEPPPSASGEDAAASRRPLAAQGPATTSPNWLAAEEPATDSPGPLAGDEPGRKAAKPKQFSDFRRTLAQVADHPSPRYFILKSIIIGNLYGVDIMEEAVEICKLRLFLKLVAQLDRVEQVEPLPDVDFNIRAGNTLVGYVSLDEIRQAVERERGGQKKLAFSDAQEEVAAIEEKAEIADRAYQRFREMQTEQGMDGSQFTEAKQELRRRLDALAQDLDRHLAGDYALTPQDRDAFAAWRTSYQPFHWFAEFYGIMKRGGFDVIIGNPPYIEYAKVRKIYTLPPHYAAFATNLYSACAYRAHSLKSACGRASLIVPVSLPSTDRMVSLRELLRTRHIVHYVSFSTRPSKLFEGAEQRLTIYIQGPANESILYSGGYLKWSTQERAHLFSASIEYTPVTTLETRNRLWPKIRGPLESKIFGHMISHQTLSATGMLHGKKCLYYKNTGLRYFNTVTLRPPKCWINGVATASSRQTELYVAAEYYHAVHTLLLSSTYFLFYQLTSNCRDLNPSDISSMPVPDLSASLARLNSLSQEVEVDYTSKGRIIKMNNRLTGLVELESVTPARSKAIIDEIDRVLARHYGFSAEQCDYIINHDIKFRMGQDEGDDEE